MTFYNQEVKRWGRQILEPGCCGNQYREPGLMITGTSEKHGIVERRQGKYPDHQQERSLRKWWLLYSKMLPRQEAVGAESSLRTRAVLR